MKSKEYLETQTCWKLEHEVEVKSKGQTEVGE
jgi:hypothetical protein